MAVTDDYEVMEFIKHLTKEYLLDEDQVERIFLMEYEYELQDFKKKTKLARYEACRTALIRCKRWYSLPRLTLTPRMLGTNRLSYLFFSSIQ